VIACHRIPDDDMTRTEIAEMETVLWS